MAPLDWCDSRIDGGNIADADNSGILNGSHILIKELAVKVSGIQVYGNNQANQYVNIKNLVRYVRSFVES